MEQSAGRTREDFHALGSFRGDAAGLFAATNGRDFDIELWDWIAAASPHPDSAPDDQVEHWAAAWLFASRWACTVRRHPAFIAHAKRAGIGPLLNAVREHIIDIAVVWDWPAAEAIAEADTSRLEWASVLLAAAEHGFGRVQSWVGLDPESPIARTVPDSWRAALRLELRHRGRLPRSYREVADYDGAERVIIAPTQLDFDEAGRAIPRSRMIRILDEWCELFASGPTSIRSLEIGSRAPRRLVAALRGQTQLRAISIKWGDYDDIGALAHMPSLWTVDLGGASALTDLAPLRSATSLRVLRIELSRRLIDYSPIADMRALEELVLAPGTVTRADAIPDLEFVRGLPKLNRLHLGARVLSGDYGPLLDHREIGSMWVLRQRRMTPSYSDLEARIPGLVEHW